MLRKIRLTLAIVCFTLVTLLFLDFTGSIHHWFSWLAKIQFMPAILALNVGIIIFLVLLTLLFGRVYCSIICPLGVFQDIIAAFRKRKKRNPYTYSPAISWLRYTILVLFIVACVAGIGSFVALLSPYSSYGRIASNLFAPVYQSINNLLALLSEHVNSYTFYSTDVWLKSLPTFIIALITLIIIVVLAWKNGRTYCNTICPVGTVLGFLSRFSLFKIRIDTKKCISCNLCAKRCKSACIDVKNHTIDYSRCVACMDCIDNCHQDAIHFGTTSSNTKSQAKASSSDITDQSKRSFLSISALLATSSLLQAQEKKVDGGLAKIEKKQKPERQTPIVPPGAESSRNFAQHCTGCQLCVSVCPNQVLRPSANIWKLMQPEMSYEYGYCRPECTNCSEVCPTGAIRLIDRAQKSSIQIGHAVWIKKNCIVIRDEVECNNCERHCPTHAIEMVPLHPEDKNSHKIPAINTERCIGCGACENLCPARPFSAIYVEGHEVHRYI